MSFLTIFALLIVGCIGASSYLLSKFPTMQPFLDKIAPYQGIIGVVCVVIGLFTALSSTLQLFKALVYIASALVLLGLGLTFGLQIIQGFLPNNNNTSQKLSTWNNYLIPYQGKLGLVALALSAWGLFAKTLGIS